jgi:SNF2 family DNA or RNA helicase
MEGLLLDRIRGDRSDPDRAGRLLGALVELPSYLDRSTEDLLPFEVRYPESLGGELIARARQFPASWKAPKEEWLVKRLREALGRGERVLVFLRHTGSKHLPHRIMKLVREVTPRVAWLDSKKVAAPKREEWIDRHVIDADIKVLLVNPNAVRTGLNNLVAFSTAIWMELDYSATTYRQANGRLHRIGQERPVTIWMPYYRGTAQQIAFELISRKITASLQVDGLDLQAALEAAGASAESTASMATAMSLGQAVHAALTSGAA